MTPRPAPPVPPRDLTSLQRAICARARDFEIAALLDLLASLGYRPGDVYFRGHVTETPQPTLVHHIEFADLEGDLAGSAPAASVELGSRTELAAPAPPGPPRRPRTDAHTSPVTVTVNLGLLSCRSPLPSYFQHLLRDTALQEPLVELLQIVDRNLLRARLTCDRPERIVEPWDEITLDLVRIHGLDSRIGLSWLFRHVFPELPSIVERTSDELRVPYAAARLGFSALGSACLGASTRIDVHDFQVTLRAGESVLRPGVPWLHELDRRLRTIVFPALEPVSMNLTIVLELADDRAFAMLRTDREPPRESYLGMDPLGVPGVPRVSGGPARRIVLYRGLLPHHQPDTDEIERALAAQARVTVTAAPSVPLGDARAEDTQADRAPSGDCELVLALPLGGLVHRYHATVRWGARAWFRDEPYAIELRGGHLPQAAPTARHHPQLWSLLRDRARQSLSSALAVATLVHYGVTSVTDAMVADLIARGQDAALHALLADGVRDVPRDAWERFVRAQPS
jgi:hypothetical protein